MVDELQPGQHVMSDRGFTVTDELAEKGMVLHCPAFLGTHRTQLKAGEVTKTRRIAEARVHVERAIERIKEFRILEGEIDPSLMHCTQQVFHVCSWLTNFQCPIVESVVYAS